jgi:hypothetical protein
MTVEQKGQKLVITIDLQKPELSKSGKTMVVASTKGCVQTDLLISGKPVTIGLNAYISK